jgi:alginate O-acetyltransferase complex protein AlgI
MQFTQPVFLLFIFLFFIGWRFINEYPTLRLVYLVMASAVFYGSGNWHNLWVLLAIILITYLCGLGMTAQPRFKRLILLVSLVTCFGLLFFYRYSAFIMQNLAGLAVLVGFQLTIKPLSLNASYLPPLGISFYVLQAASYLLDVYHGRLQPSRNLLQISAYLALFPKLLAGPIERGKDLLPQLISDHTATDEAQRWQGTKWIVFGYFSKVVIADNLAPFVDTAFSAPIVWGGALHWWLVITAFAIQLLFDFSGYSAIALGLGRWMGYNLTPNFSHPYHTTSLAEFWSSWHITFSNWLRDYIFFPLNRSKVGRKHPHINAWITMLLSGLWHGAAWHFIFWGGLHGLFISLERRTNWAFRLRRLHGGRWLAGMLVLVQVWIGWVFFRARDMQQGWQILKAMFSFDHGTGIGLDINSAIFLGLGILIVALSGLHYEQQNWIPARLFRAGEVVLVSLSIVGCLLFSGPGSQFIYLNF